MMIIQFILPPLLGLLCNSFSSTYINEKDTQVDLKCSQVIHLGEKSGGRITMIYDFPCRYLQQPDRR